MIRCSGMRCDFNFICILLSIDNWTFSRRLGWYTMYPDRFGFVYFFRIKIFCCSFQQEWNERKQNKRKLHQVKSRGKSPLIISSWFGWFMKNFVRLWLKVSRYNPNIQHIQYFFTHLYISEVLKLRISFSIIKHPAWNIISWSLWSLWRRDVIYFLTGWCNFDWGN